MEATRVRHEPTRIRPPARESTVAVPAAPAPSLDRPPAPAPPPAATGKRSRRLLRWVIGGAMIAEAAWLAGPTFLFRTSVRATVIAPRTTIRLHQTGLVSGTPPAVGASLQAGQPLFDVQAPALDHRPTERAEAEAESIRRTASSLRQQIAEMDELKKTLANHFAEYRAARVAQAEKQWTEQLAREQSAASRLNTAEFERRVQGRLSSKGASSDVELGRSDHALAEARHEFDVAHQAAERLRLQLEAAQKGYFVGEADGGQDRVASMQRCDEIELQQSALRARLGELDGRLHELESRLASEQRYLTDSKVSIVAPVQGEVWSSTLTPGSQITPGSVALEIVDPNRLSIEAFFKEADAEKIRPGAPVKVRLVGSSQVLRAHVARVTDTATIDDSIVGSCPRETVPPGSFRAIISLDEQPAGGASENRHHVGGSAIVWAAR